MKLKLSKPVSLLMFVMNGGICQCQASGLTLCEYDPDESTAYHNSFCDVPKSQTTIFPANVKTSDGYGKLSGVDILGKELAETLIKIISGDAGVSALFPQKEEDLDKIDDLKRNQFIYLVRWCLPMFTPEVAGALKKSVLEIDRNFVTLVNEKWGEGIYKTYSDVVTSPLPNCEIPQEVLGGLSVESIISINPDFISNSIDEEFRKLILIINVVSKYSNSTATLWLENLKKQIKKTVNSKFSPEAICAYLDSHSQSEVEKSVMHYRSWVKLVSNF